MSVLYSRAAHLFERRNIRINLDFNLECLLYLVEVGQLRDLVPEVPHDLAVLLVPLVAPLPLGLDHRVADGQGEGHRAAEAREPQHVLVLESDVK